MMILANPPEHATFSKRDKPKTGHTRENNEGYSREDCGGGILGGNINSND
jgi:hypothetical protein